jgi:hypothetical protein
MVILLYFNVGRKLTNVGRKLTRLIFLAAGIPVLTHLLKSKFF